MRAFAPACPIACSVFLVAIVAHAETNVPSGLEVPLDQKTLFTLTAGLEQYDNVPRLTGKVVSAGGGTPTILVGRWAAEFAAIYPDVEIGARGGGNVGGLADLLEGKVDLVPIARPMQSDEAARFKAKFGYEPAQIIVAQDAIAVYVNRRNPIAGLTLAQLDAVYSRNPRRGGGRPEFWLDLGVTGPVGTKLIKRVCLSRVFGSCQYFQDYVMQGEEYRFDVQFEPVNGSMVQAVGVDEEAIGFASVMFATERTRFVPLQAADGQYLAPNYENTSSANYPLVRPMRVVFNRKPNGSMNPVAREFLRFAVSRRGQRIIGLAGSYPITLEQQREAMRVIGEGPER